MPVFVEGNVEYAKCCCGRSGQHFDAAAATTVGRERSARNEALRNETK